MLHCPWLLRNGVSTSACVAVLNPRLPIAAAGPALLAIVSARGGESGQSSGWADLFGLLAKGGLTTPTKYEQARRTRPVAPNNSRLDRSSGVQHFQAHWGS
jgi:hypothetical protein